jgi:hypothetical protein
MPDRLNNHEICNSPTLRISNTDTKSNIAYASDSKRAAILVEPNVVALSLLCCRANAGKLYLS